MHHLLHDIGLAIVVATVLAYLARLLRQPVLLAYIAAGILIGPNIGKPMFTAWFGEAAASKLVGDPHSLEVLGELGLTFLMFIVGLEMDIRKLLKSGTSAAVLGIVQVAGCGVLLWLAGLALGFRGLSAAYIGVAGAFTSTMIVVKLLSDKRVIDTTSGRLVLAVLIIQDVLAIIVLGIQPNLTNPHIGPIAVSLAKGLGLAAGAVIFSRLALPRLFQAVAMMPEVLLITAMSWCFLISWLAIKSDFSIAMGALIAGVAMSGLPYALDVIAKIRGLRDFFVTLFFVALGAQIVKPSASFLLMTFALSGFVVVSRFATVLPSLLALRHDSRIGILSSIDLIPVSEFSIVIATIGFKLGHVPQDVVSAVIMAMVITSTLTTYASRYDKQISKFLSGFLARLGVKKPAGDDAAAPKEQIALLILGCHRVTSALLKRLKDRTDYVIVDFNAIVCRDLKAKGFRCLYGDLSHADTLEEAGIHHAHVILSTISDDFLHGTNNANIVRVARRMNAHATIIGTAERRSEAKNVYDAGADFVVIPKLSSASDFDRFLKHAEAGEKEKLREEGLASLATSDEVLD